MGFEYFELDSRGRLVAVTMIVVIGAAGWYIGARNDRFLVCADFERIGDHQPDNCREPG